MLRIIVLNINALILTFAISEFVDKYIL